MIQSHKATFIFQTDSSVKDLNQILMSRNMSCLNFLKIKEQQDSHFASKKLIAAVLSSVLPEDR